MGETRPRAHGSSFFDRTWRTRGTFQRLFTIPHRFMENALSEERLRPLNRVHLSTFDPRHWFPGSYKIDSVRKLPLLKLSALIEVTLPQHE